jgi:hypothetical protein
MFIQNLIVFKIMNEGELWEYLAKLNTQSEMQSYSGEIKE